MEQLSEGHTEGTQEPMSVLTKQRQIAELARQHPERVFIALNHYLDYEWLLRAYELTRKDGAVGIDGVSAQAYARNLRANLEGLLERMIWVVSSPTGPPRLHSERGRNSQAVRDSDL